MKYLLLCCFEEKRWEALPQSQRDGIMRELTFEGVDTPCGTGANCVEMETGSIGGAGCGSFTPSSINLSTGGIQAMSTMRLLTTWENATDERLQRTLSHELTHGLGLNHNTCQNDHSLQGVHTSCTSHTGMSLTATLTDVLPTVKSTYGNGVHAACGF